MFKLLIIATLRLCILIGSSGLEKNGNVSTSETAPAINKTTDDGSPPDERAGLRLVRKVAAAGLERLDRSIRFITGHGSEGGNRDDRLSEAQGGDGDADRAESSGSAGSYEEVKESFTEVDRKWLRHLTLRQPDLLDALCQNIARQQQGGSRVQVDLQRESDADLSTESSRNRVDEGPEEDSARTDFTLLSTLEHFEVKPRTVSRVLATSSLSILGLRLSIYLVWTGDLWY